jgi:hypothetical protein
MHVTASARMVTVAIKPLTLGPLPVGRGEGILRASFWVKAELLHAVFDHSFHFLFVAGDSRAVSCRVVKETVENSCLGVRTTMAPR